MNIKVLKIDPRGDQLFIDSSGNFFYYTEYEELGDYSGHSMNYISVRYEYTNYCFYHFLGSRTEVEMAINGADEPSDPELTEIDKCIT